MWQGVLKEHTEDDVLEFIQTKTYVMRPQQWTSIHSVIVKC
jgi:hypothetical protein